jgi:hypothetical protein
MEQGLPSLKIAAPFFLSLILVVDLELERKKE